MLSRADRYFELADRVVVVTGASSGLGKGIAEDLIAAGALVVAGARRVDLLQALSQDADRLAAVQCDVRVEEDRRRLIAVAVERFGRLDGLVNNAGITGRGVPAAHETADEFSAMIDVNLRAPLDLAVKAVAAMRACGGGSIVNITSTASTQTLGTAVPQALYCSSKAGLAHLTRELAIQWGRYGVRVNAVAPGWTPSGMTGDVTGIASGMPAWVETRVALKRPGKPQDIASCVHFLLSEAASYITGQEIAVDGGWSVG